MVIVSAHLTLDITTTKSRIIVDEKAIKKRHRYFTIVSDLESGQVIWIGHGRKRETIDLTRSFQRVSALLMSGEFGS
jgi:transposase